MLLLPNVTITDLEDGCLLKNLVAVVSFYNIKAASKKGKEMLPLPPQLSWTNHDLVKERGHDLVIDSLFFLLIINFEKCSYVIVNKWNNPSTSEYVIGTP